MAYEDLNGQGGRLSFIITWIRLGKILKKAPIGILDQIKVANTQACSPALYLVEFCAPKWCLYPFTGVWYETDNVAQWGPVSAGKNLLLLLLFLTLEPCEI